MKRVIILFLLLFVIFGCKTVESKLDTPTNLRYENQQIMFDSVEHAASYLLEINEIEHPVIETTYQPSGYGTFTVRVKAIAEKGYLDSEYSEMITFEIAPEFLAPNNVKLENSILSWDYMKDGLRYHVLINDYIFVFAGEDNTISISQYFTTPFKVSVGVTYNLQDYQYSDPIIIESDKPYLSEFTIQYDAASTVDFNLRFAIHHYHGSFLKITNENSEDVTSQMYNATGGKLRSDFLSQLPNGTHTFYIEAMTGVYKLNITIKNDGKPYLISSAELYTDGTHHLDFMFDTMGGSVTSIQGNGITASDYEIHDNNVNGHSQVSIRDAFVKTLFEDASRNTIVLSYTLEKGNQIVIGYVFIHRFILE